MEELLMLVPPVPLLGVRVETVLATYVGEDNPAYTKGEQYTICIQKFKGADNRYQVYKDLVHPDIQRGHKVFNSTEEIKQQFIYES